ncbi:MAG: methyltransferase domain-containing protein, partial [Chloroflexota bacterium]
MNPDERVQWIYSSTTNQELIERYDEWAKSYDTDMIDAFDYTSPTDVVAAVLKFMKPEDKILDVGAGTGLVGLNLHSQGYKNLVALDMSPAMLAEAASKNIYQDLKQGVLGEPLDLPTDSIDGMISAGTFTWGHAPASAFWELTRITK